MTSRWRDDPWEPPPEVAAAADEAIAALQARGSPSHDGPAARLADHREGEGTLELELQPARWGLRLTGAPEVAALTALCVARDAAGRWLAGRRAEWVATWAGRWALGAGGSVETGEDPVATLRRELEEEWSVRPAALTVEALVRMPSGLVMLVGSARLPDGAEPVHDHEHDAMAWWPPDPADWPPEAEVPLRRLAAALVASG